MSHQKVVLRESDIFNVPLLYGLQRFQSEHCRYAFSFRVVLFRSLSKSTQSSHPLSAQTPIGFYVANCFPQPLQMFYNI